MDKKHMPMRQIFLKWAAWTLLLGCMATACTGKQAKPGEGRRIVKSKGLPSELLLVVDKAVWESPVADTLRKIVEGPVPGLPQAESYFRVTRILTPYYEQMYTTMHSKLFVRLDPHERVPMVGVNHDVSARPQIEVTVKAPDLESLGRFLSGKALFLRDVIADAQLQMRAAQLRKHYSKKAYDDLRACMGRTIYAPQEIKATKKGHRFLWAGTNLNEKDMNVVVYACPWEGGDLPGLMEMVALRDSVMQANIPGSNPDQWMETVREQGMPLVEGRILQRDGHRILETRGLWQMRHGALGGPFVSQAHIDSLTHELVVAEGFVYSPGTDKRDLLRMVEAAISTLGKEESCQ